MRHPVEPILLEGGGIRWVDPVNNKTPRRQEVASMTRDQAAKAIKADIGEDAAARRQMDESTMTGRQLPCGSECIEASKDKRWG